MRSPGAYTRDDNTTLWRHASPQVAMMSLRKNLARTAPRRATGARLHGTDEGADELVVDLLGNRVAIETFCGGERTRVVTAPISARRGRSGCRNLGMPARGHGLLLLKAAERASQDRFKADSHRGDISANHSNSSRSWSSRTISPSGYTPGSIRGANVTGEIDPGGSAVRADSLKRTGAASEVLRPP